MPSGEIAASSLIGRRLAVGFGVLLLPTLFARCASVETAKGLAAQREAALPADAPVLYLVTAADCPPCTKWEREFRPSFENSPERAKLRFVILHSPNVRIPSYSDAVWPDNARWIREELQKRKVAPAYPMFVLVHKGLYIEVASGEFPDFAYGWKGNLLPAIRKEIGGT